MKLQDKQLSLKEAAARLGISLRTMWALVSTGKIKARKIGRQWRLRPEDLD